MPKVKKYSNESGDRQGYTLYCPGCNDFHTVRTVGPGQWGFNGSIESPTFTPSLKVTGTVPLTDDEATRIMAGEKIEPTPFVCHSHITDGNIQFLGDCTHDLKGQTVPLEDVSKWE